MVERIQPALDEACRALSENRERPWIIAFSGGKDSTAALKIMVAAARKLGQDAPTFDLIYCDTGVENPIVDSYVKSTLERLSQECSESEISLNVSLLRAPVQQRFFVKVIGRGYPTPTNSFRWCTKELRIKPVASFIREKLVDDAIVVIGSRLDESEQRKRSMGGANASRWQKQREGKGEYDIYLPILDFTVSDVWDSIFAINKPESIDCRELEEIYWGASEECPIIRSPNESPCASGRFGCWTCTVVRRDHSAEQLIKSGRTELKPFLELRNWLAEFRNRHDMRWSQRRNGARFPGPFSLRGRRLILDRVRELESTINVPIIGPDELTEITRLWELDKEHECEISNS
ncbi:phosphoadenosine phosphosulfate reductase family protein [Rhodosalinus sp. K401]|uniref:phosphoadenosine phosphosulfate reductase domain-containing protein n=1 Tax=Rhodosalinus sp. K401 TaxID=3239195 RepID=UPI0035231954